MKVKGRVYEGIMMLITLYGAETWNMGASERRLIALEMKCFRSMCGVTHMYQVRIAEV